MAAAVLSIDHEDRTDGIQRQPASGRHRVVVIGAGFAGIAAVRALRDAPVDITVIEANNFHTFQPLLYQVATAGLSADDVARPIRSVFGGGRSRNVESVMGAVGAIDTDRRKVHTESGLTVPYDSLVIAAGAVSNDFGIKGVEQYGLPLKSLDDALALNRHLIATFEGASRRADDLPPGALDVVISGGGPTGVELAGGIAELYEHVLVDDFPELPVCDARIVLVEMADRLLPPFSEKSSARAESTLEKLGVEVRVGVGVETIDEHCVTLDDGTRVDTHTIIWAAGVKAHPLAEALGVELGKGGRIPVDPDLSVTGLDGVYAIGDIAAATDPDGDPLPQVAQPAIQSGRHVGEQIARRVAGRPTESFTYTDKGSMATIGRHSAVADLPNGWKLGGWIGWISWLLLHLVYLVGFRNRLVVFVNWCWNYLTFDRPSRLLSSDAVAADDNRGEAPADAVGEPG